VGGLAHRLRRAPDYRDTLALPLQTYLANIAEEYVLPHDSSDAGPG
jgi:RNaseH domain of pPIWI_RE